MIQHLLQALNELREKYEKLQEDVGYIKEHLKLSTIDKHTANGTFSGTPQHPSTGHPSARMWIFGGHDGSDWMSDSRIFHIHKYEQLILKSLSCPHDHAADAFNFLPGFSPWAPLLAGMNLCLSCLSQAGAEVSC